MTEKMFRQFKAGGPGGSQADMLGANSEIGSKLRALYASVQDEGIPAKLLDLLERLDAAESRERAGRAGE